MTDQDDRVRALRTRPVIGSSSMRKAVILSAWCAVCANDDPKEFTFPDTDEDVEE